MEYTSKGLHHISIISGDAQRNADFYVNTLGLKMVLKTVNQDDPGSYHLFYANGSGQPGSSITFFPWPRATRGKPGTGESVAISFAVPTGSLDFWVEWFGKMDVDFEGPFTRFDYQVINFSDPDGLQLEVVFDPKVNDLPAWDKSKVPTNHGIRGFWGTTLHLADGNFTSEVLENVMGFEKKDTAGRFSLYRSGSAIGNAVIIEKADHPVRGNNGRGIVHHVAFRAKDEEEQKVMQKELQNRGLYPTEVIDRHVFKSVYCHMPEGVLFEIATDGPGYAVAQSEDEMGTKLFLPHWLEPNREAIERNLPEIDI
ncbi:MAG: VOC family protein [Balneolales bacterium]